MILIPQTKQAVSVLHFQNLIFSFTMSSSKASLTIIHPQILSLYTYTFAKTPPLKSDNFSYAFTLSVSYRFLSETIEALPHVHAIVDGVDSDLFVGSSIVDMHLNFSKVGHAYKVFDGIPEPDTVLWNTMISGLVRKGCLDEGIRVFGDMVVRGTRFDSTTLAVVLPAAAELSAGMMLQYFPIKIGFHCHVYVLNGLISLYSKCREMSTARWLFEQIGRPDLISYNALISGFSCNSETASAVGIFRELLMSGEKVNSSAIVGLIPVFYPFGHLDITCSTHGFCFKYGLVSNSSASAALTTVYSQPKAPFGNDL